MYSREINGQVLNLSASGWTYDYTFVLYDYETETMWYHMPGEDKLTGIAGVYADSTLAELPSTFTRWFNWTREHPQTRFLKYP